MGRKKLEWYPGAMYAKNFNKKYNFIGHLFQSRYNVEIIEKDGYVLEVSSYSMYIANQRGSHPLQTYGGFDGNGHVYSL